ncbi:hypothetical protein [Actinomadura madurae]|uniref:hypothetical protein n=1 Tax=Actinomadura madurae TaxID=1993 RepID=UPI0020D1FCCE|nr:hypothetical protein [Actinomadura madurae]MCP9952063.1 hypothetical protein [Actinomadura madurae]MCP9981301.1 hypothetical protein [Actinomadura madurae]MCQ0007192.1 hypothetical protein [Actinomadura madurae]
MNSATRIGAYAVGLAVVFGGAAGIGKITGPVGEPAAKMASHENGGGHAGGGEGGHGGGHTAAAAHAPGGLQVSEDGYTLTPQRTTVTPGEKTDFRFTITGPDGKPVTAFKPLHGKPLHLIVARRDLAGFQHLHPTQLGGGVWSVQIKLPKAGVYRFFTDIQPTGATRQLTLGTDVFAPGDQKPTPLPKPEQVAKVDGYEVKLTGGLTPGKSTELTLTVSKDGRPVTDLQPYLEAYGHLVALRQGDLAYLHVHPDGEPGDGVTEPGPGITFSAEAPSSGAYRLYLDFKHGGKVRTAEFTVHAGDARVPAQEAEPGHDDRPHTH